MSLIDKNNWRIFLGQFSFTTSYTQSNFSHDLGNIGFYKKRNGTVSPIYKKYKSKYTFLQEQKLIKECF